ncbi:hypothetical protein A8L44_04070 [Bacillus sp. FJAT-27986]|nr:hypothetical protein A8L44_04070 [Bacillus sp. FJAT-27986]
MSLFLLILILFSGFISILFYSIISLGKGGVYPARRVLKKRIHMSGIWASVLLLVLILIWKL